MSLRRTLVVLFALTFLAAACESFTGVGLRVAITPAEPGDDDPLEVVIVTSPVGDEDTTWTYSYAWSRNDQEQADLTTAAVPADRTELGDVWSVEVVGTADDGTTTDPALATVELEAAPVDADNDGYSVEDDCDDTNPNINPAAVEICNALDDDCNGTVDDGTTGDFRDDDNDGFDNCSDDGEPGGDGTDCNDQNAAVNPDAVEECNGNRDDDCDGVDDPDEIDDDGDLVTECGLDCDDTDPDINPLDADADGASTCDPIPDCDDTDPALNVADADSDGSTTCDGDCDDANAAANALDEDEDGVTTCGPDGIFDTPDDDCDDDDAHNFPGNVEACDNADNDCDGVAEVGTADVDGDSFTVCDGDCDDNDAHINPGITEICDGIDNDCANGVDDGFPNVDGDGFAACLDCDDNDPTAFPGGTEICDGADNDCANGVDDGFDGDNDGVTTCGPDGIPGNADDDCADGDPNINPTVVEVCDGVDENCDGVVDDGFDADTDLFTTCGADGVAGNADDDCNDNVPTIFPGAAEIIDGLDQDCDGINDEYTWSQIQTVVFQNNCGCHNGGAHSTGMHSLTGAAGYGLVVGAQAQRSTWLRVDPGNPGLSFLLSKIEWTQGTAPPAGPGVGANMPLGAGLPIAQDHRTGITNWITAGAPND